jgi:hypothetical protein
MAHSQVTDKEENLQIKDMVDANILNKQVSTTYMG